MSVNHRWTMGQLKAALAFFPATFRFRDFNVVAKTFATEWDKPTGLGLRIRLLKLGWVRRLGYGRYEKVEGA